MSRRDELIELSRKNPEKMADLFLSLEARIIALEKRLRKNSQNSDKPPSSDRLSKPKKAKAKSKRKAGGRGEADWWVSWGWPFSGEGAGGPNLPSETDSSSSLLLVAGTTSTVSLRTANLKVGLFAGIGQFFWDLFSEGE